MTPKTKTIFISSTFEDLKSHRRKIWDLLATYDVNVRGMEKFGARKEAPLATCLSEVEQCDVFLGIIAFKLGSVDSASGKSFTQREYEIALELKKDILIYVADEKDSKISPQDIDFDEPRQKLIAFKSILKERHTVDTFISEDDLTQKIKRKFDELLTQKQESEVAGKDEYVQSKELIDMFLLLPRLYSGREARCEVDFVGEPFPASKLLCERFNLDYGKTIGVQIQIKKPQVEEDSIPYAFIDEDNLTTYFSLKEKRNIEIYGKLQFSPDEVDKIRANFVRKVYVTSSMSSVWTYQAAPILGYQPNLFGETTVVKADGAIIIKVTKLLPKQK